MLKNQQYQTGILQLTLMGCSRMCLITDACICGLNIYQGFILITEINIIKSMSSSLRISRRVSATFGLILAVQSASVPKTNFLSDTRLGVRQNLTSVLLTSSLRPILRPTCIQPSMPWNGKIC